MNFNLCLLDPIKSWQVKLILINNINYHQEKSLLNILLRTVNIFQSHCCKQRDRQSHIDGPKRCT